MQPILFFSPFPFHQYSHFQRENDALSKRKLEMLAGLKFRWVQTAALPLSGQCKFEVYQSARERERAT